MREDVREVASDDHLPRLSFCKRQFIDFKTSMITDYDPRRGLLFFAFVFQTTDKIRENAQSLDTECPTPLTHHFRHNGGRSQVISSLRIPELPRFRQNSMVSQRNLILRLPSLGSVVGTTSSTSGTVSVSG